MGFETVLGAGIGLLGNAITSNNNRNAVRDATNAQVGAANQQIQLYDRIYRDQTGRLEPFRLGEVDNLNIIRELYGLPAIDANVGMSGGSFTSSRTGGNAFNYGREDIFAPTRAPYQMPQGERGRGGNAFNFTTSPGGTYPGNVPQATGTAQPTSQDLQANALQRFEDSPFYSVFTNDFNRDRDNIDTSLARSGLNFSGARMSAIEDSRARNFGNAFSSYLAPLFGQVPQSATQGANAAAGAYGANTAGALGNIGTAQAEGAYGRAEANNAFIGSLGGMFGYGTGRYF